MQKYQNNIASSVNNALFAVPNAIVSVKKSNGVLATIYSDNGVTATANPITTDAVGNFSFYAADGRYDISISSANATTQIITDLLLEDPLDGADASFITNIAGTNTITGLVNSITITAYSTGQIYRFIASGTNTGATTLNINGIGAKIITKNGTNALVANDINSGDAIQVIYDGTQFQLVGKNTFIGSGTGAVLRSIQDKSRDIVSVKDFNAKGDGLTDDSTAFQNAANSLPAAGGTILVPDGAYVINTAPIWGAKSIQWTFGANSTVTGTQTTFPRMNTNTAQVPVGIWIQSQSTVPSPNGGGIAAGNFEMLQPASYNGQSVALYTGARGSSPTGNVWSINPLIQADVGAGGTYQGLEIDVNNFSASALVKGISINGVGTVNPAIGIEIIRTGTAGSAGALWQSGITINQSILAINILAGTGFSRGIAINSPTAINTALISTKQYVNGGEGLFLQRFTDTSPSGFFLRCTNAANSVNLLQIDVSGNLSMAGALTATGNVNGNISLFSNSVLTAGANPVSAGQLSFGSTTATSATAGANGATPSQVAYYLQFYNGATLQKIPVYNA